MADHEGLLGKQVRVTLDTNVVVTGQLLSFGDMGSLVIRDGDGEVHHAWPMLNVEEVAGEAE